MSSATPTDPDAGKAADGVSQAALIRVVAWGLAVAIGLVVVFRLNHWHIGPPQVILALGWIGVLATGQFLWRAGFDAADDVPAAEALTHAGGARGDLEREKRALLKAIKEIEFDHEMGKHSDEDAAELTRLYRAKAIEILKILEGLDADGNSDELDIEVKARMIAEGDLQPRKKKGARKAAAAAAAKANDGEAEAGKSAPATSGEADSMAKPQAGTEVDGREPPLPAAEESPATVEGNPS